jgi:hypothetical protein
MLGTGWHVCTTNVATHWRGQQPHAQRIGVAVGTVRAWRDRFAEDGLAKSGQARWARPQALDQRGAARRDVRSTLHS